MRRRTEKVNDFSVGVFSSLGVVLCDVWLVWGFLVFVYFGFVCLMVCFLRNCNVWNSKS